MGTTVVLGGQWGDEGKGKLVDILTDSVDLCARCQGGNNAGHTIVRNGKTYDFHLLPSGLLNPKCTNLIGTGVVVHVPSFFKELESFEEKGLDTKGRIFISNRAHVVFDLHQMVDGIEETALADKSVGTTKKGIGPAYSKKAARTGVRIAELFDWELFESKLRTMARSYKAQYGELLQYDVEEELKIFKDLVPLLEPFVVDSMYLTTQAERAKESILVEGVNAIMLDLDWGTYPYVTSSNTGIGGAFTGLGISPFNVKRIIGVVKAYTTRVGWGPLPTEQLNEVGERLQKSGKEFGVTTGRKRRCGWLDLVVVRYSAALNHYTSINITKLDVLDGFPELKICVGYSYHGKKLDSFPVDLSILAKVELEYKTMPGWQTPTRGCKTFSSLPLQAREYIEFIEGFVGVKAEFIGTGPERESWISR